MNYAITRVNTEDELYHYGVPGMKWGKRKASYSKASTAIKSLSNPTTFIKKDGYQKSKIPSGAFVKKDGYQKHRLPFETRSVYSKEISAKQIAKKSYKAASKAYKKLEKQRVKDLQKQYGSLEDQMTYGKNTNLKKNSQLEKEMKRIENMTKTPSSKEAANKRRGNI